MGAKGNIRTGRRGLNLPIAVGIKTCPPDPTCVRVIRDLNFLPESL